MGVLVFMAGVDFIMVGFIGGFFYGDSIEDLTIVSFIRDLTAGDFTQSCTIQDSMIRDSTIQDFTVGDFTLGFTIEDSTVMDSIQGFKAAGLIGDFTTDVCLSFSDGGQPLVLCLSPLSTSIG